MKKLIYLIFATMATTLINTSCSDPDEDTESIMTEAYMDQRVAEIKDALEAYEGVTVTRSGDALDIAIEGLDKARKGHNGLSGVYLTVETRALISVFDTIPQELTAFLDMIPQPEQPSHVDLDLTQLMNHTSGVSLTYPSRIRTYSVEDLSLQYSQLGQPMIRFWQKADGTRGITLCLIGCFSEPIKWNLADKKIID